MDRIQIFKRFQKNIKNLSKTTLEIFFFKASFVCTNFKNQ